MNEPIATTLDDVRIAAQMLRDEMTESLKKFVRITGERKPEVRIGWRDVTQLEDEKTRYAPMIFIEFKVHA